LPAFALVFLLRRGAEGAMMIKHPGGFLKPVISRKAPEGKAAGKHSKRACGMEGLENEIENIPSG
jgi:hypothetical protein